MPYKGEFKTAYLQREIPVDAAVMQGNGLVVGNLVKLVKAGANTVPYIVAATGNDKDAALADATHIIAQSDMTLEYGHVPVENRDYKYSPKVAVTAASIGTSSPKKKVALFKLVNKDDVTAYTVS